MTSFNIEITQSYVRTYWTYCTDREHGRLMRFTGCCEFSRSNCLSLNQTVKKEKKNNELDSVIDKGKFKIFCMLLACIYVHVYLHCTLVQKFGAC